MKKVLLLVLASFLLSFQAIADVTPGVPLVFKMGPGVDPANVFVVFPGTTGDTFKAYCNNSTGSGESNVLQANTSYSMSALTGTTSVGGGAPANVPAVYVTQFSSGRVYISLDDQLSWADAGYTPDATNTNDVNYNIRYQYIEPTIVGAQINVDMSYIDFTAISMSLEAKNAPHASNNPQKTIAPSLQLIQAAAKSSATPYSNVLPSSADMFPSANFARVISTHLGPTNYHDWTTYLTDFMPGKSTLISGCYAGTQQPENEQPPMFKDSTTQQQSYEFNATYSGVGDVTLTSLPGSGNGTGFCTDEATRVWPGIGDNVTITIDFADLNAPVGIYGNNPVYTVDWGNGTITTTLGIVNDITGRVVGDLLAGISWGFVGSEVVFNGKKIGDMSSTLWWGNANMPDDGRKINFADTPAGQGYGFSNVQPNEPLNYDRYAASFSSYTPAYGFALQDRGGNNLIAFNTGTCETCDSNGYLEVTINSDFPVSNAGINLLLLE